MLQSELRCSKEVHMPQTGTRAPPPKALSHPVVRGEALEVSLSLSK